MTLLGLSVSSDTGITSCDTSVGVEASEESEVAEFKQDYDDSKITEISFGEVSFFLDVSNAYIFLEMCKRFQTLKLQ